jgi:hypothetical protein
MRLVSDQVIGSESTAFAASERRGAGSEVEAASGYPPEYDVDRRRYASAKRRFGTPLKRLKCAQIANARRGLAEPVKSTRRRPSGSALKNGREAQESGLRLIGCARSGRTFKSGDWVKTTLHDPGEMAGIYRSEMQSARLHFARQGCGERQKTQLSARKTYLLVNGFDRDRNSA